MSEPDRYEVGYRDGESSATADWVFALSEWTQIGDDVATPADAVAYVQRLETIIAQVDTLASIVERRMMATATPDEIRAAIVRPAEAQQ